MAEEENNISSGDRALPPDAGLVALGVLRRDDEETNIAPNQYSISTDSTNLMFVTAQDIAAVRPVIAASDPLPIVTAGAEIMTLGVPVDPLVATQWHLTGTWGLHADQVWNDYTGGGSLVAVLDDGFQTNHYEFAANYRTDLDWDTLGNDGDPSPATSTTNNHGTAVTGIIAGDDNGLLGTGVAFDAQIFGVRQGFGAQGNLDQTVAAFQHVFAKNADVMNNSWGYTTAFSDDFNREFGGTDFYAVENEIINLVNNGRGGLGTNIVFSGGNNRAAGENVNYHNHQNSPYIIAVAAIDSDGTWSAFSNPGAALLVAAGGTLVKTTDRTGADGYVSGDTVSFSGTSASAPVVAGMLAVLLEANSDLGWRDVQEILAYSAQHNDSGDVGWQYNGAGNWNGGGLHFSHDYGFGAADLFTAVRLAETWTLQQTSANMTTIAPISASPALAIPDNGTITTAINVAQDIEIEHILIDLDISHAKAGDLIVTLISPDGTESVLINRPQNGAFTSMYVTGIDFETSSNAHWGESSAGLWTLKIQDAAGGNTGTLNSWSLSFMGNAQSADDVYIYTNDYGNFSAGQLVTRGTLSDAGGTDTINLAAVTSNTTLNMNAGTASTVAGKALNIAGGATIENAYLGDGSDAVTGNAANNTIYGGRGNDTVIGSTGSDTLDGQQGTDTADYSAWAAADFTFNFIDAVSFEMTKIVGGWMDTLRNFESFIFSEGTFNRQQLEDLVNSGPMGSIALDFVYVGRLTTHTSVGVESLILTARDLQVANTNENLISVTRAANGLLTLDYLSTNAPDRLTLNGSADVDRITINGIDAGLVPVINAGAGNDVITLVNPSYTSLVHGDDGADTITGSVTGDTLYGDAGDDTLNGGGGVDKLYGGIGMDMLSGGDSGDRMWGGADNDILNGDNGADRLYGEAGADQLNGGADADYLYGGDGDDVLHGNAGDDWLYGDAGVDTIDGDAGGDKIYGGLGNDVLNGGDGYDAIYGDDNDDTINGGADADYLYGGNGNDVVNGDGGNDRMQGDVGVDQMNGGLGSDYMRGGTGNDVMHGDDGNDSLYGDADSDTLYGDDGADRLYGGDGIDSLYGGAGNDWLYGNAGNDLLVGGAGTDYLTGGTGADQFGFTVLGDGLDQIADFSVADTDKLNITDLLSGFVLGVDDIGLFVNIRYGANIVVSVNADGVGSDFTAAMYMNGTVFAGQSAQNLLDSGILVVNQTLL